MKDTHLCICGNCDAILIDENPQSGAALFDLADFPTYLYMERFRDDKNDPETEFWGCPNCETDGYLMDLYE